LARLSFAAHDLADTLELLRHSLIGGHDLVEGVGNLAVNTEMIAGHSHRKVTAAHRLQGLQQFLRRIRLSIAVGLDFDAPTRRVDRTEFTHGIEFPSKKPEKRR
jgi:hypothetical protein